MVRLEVLVVFFFDVFSLWHGQTHFFKASATVDSSRNDKKQAGKLAQHQAEVLLLSSLKSIAKAPWPNKTLWTFVAGPNCFLQGNSHQITVECVMLGE